MMFMVLTPPPPPQTSTRKTRRGPGRPPAALREALSDAQALSDTDQLMVPPHHELALSLSSRVVIARHSW